MNYTKFFTIAALNIAFIWLIYYFFSDYLSLAGMFFGSYLAELYHRVKIET